MAEFPLPPHAASAGELKDRVDAERAGQSFLVYRDGGGVQRILVLPEERPRLTVGRSSASDLQIGWDTEVSRLHVQLERLGDAWVLADDGLSRNGSFVNGRRVQGRRRLRDGDVLRCGETIIAYRDPSEADKRSTTIGSDLGPIAAITTSQCRVLVALCRPFKHDEAIAAPATNQQIAEELFLSIDLVKTHLRTLAELLGAEGLPPDQRRLRLVELAFETGLVTDGDL